MKYTEETALFACAGDILLGILAKPETPADTGVVVVVGGPQYRVGSHRQFVLLARSLAAAGYAVLRFDYRGMGDSEGQQREFQTVSADIAAAIDTLQASVPSVEHVALWGLCDGASAALLYCHETRDPRVTGLCLLNPWVRSEASLAKTELKHYYTQRLGQKEFWIKLFSGKVARAALAGLWRNIRLVAAGPNSCDATLQMPFQRRMAMAWRNFDGGVLLLLSGQDYTAKEFLESASTDAAWTGLLEPGLVARHDLPHADHTFSSRASRSEVEVLTLRWLHSQTNLC